jgi:GlpG protein
MRQLVTLSVDSAPKLAGYLQTQSIETRLDETADGVIIWVCDEDRVAQAREIAQHFQQHSDDERYRGVPRLEPKQEERPSPRSAPPWNNQPQNQFTLSLIVLSVLITALFHSQPQQQLVASYAFMTDVEVLPNEKGYQWRPGLREIRAGEVWRLVTPIFVHFGVFHLLFNMLWLYDFGGQIEKRSGPLWLALMVLLIAVGSNQCQYLFSEVSPAGLLFWVENPQPFILLSSPVFGGMSGVVFGLFGYIWIRSIYDPGCGLAISPRNTALLLIWMVVCFTGLVGPVANVAHLVGLSNGMIFGYIAAWWNGFGTRREA